MSVHFVDADTGYPAGPGDAPEAPARILRRAWPHHLAAYREPVGFATDIVARARLEHGRWLVDCPLPGCAGAQYASKTHRQFHCVDCLHQATPAEGRWIRVKWPANVLEIEEALAERDRPGNRNWIPGETVAALRAQTRAAATIAIAIAAAPEIAAPLQGGPDTAALLEPDAAHALPEGSL